MDRKKISDATEMVNWTSPGSASFMMNHSIWEPGITLPTLKCKGNRYTFEIYLFQ